MYVSFSILSVTTCAGYNLMQCKGRTTLVNLTILMMNVSVPMEILQKLSTGRRLKGGNE